VGQRLAALAGLRDRGGESSSTGAGAAGARRGQSLPSGMNVRQGLGQQGGAAVNDAMDARDARDARSSVNLAQVIHHSINVCMQGVHATYERLRASTHQDVHLKKHFDSRYHWRAMWEGLLKRYAKRGALWANLPHVSMLVDADLLFARCSVFVSAPTLCPPTLDLAAVIVGKETGRGCARSCWRHVERPRHSKEVTS